MIIGIGNDFIEINRIKRACQKEAFLSRYFTVEERKMFQENYVKYAGCFAVKEAVSKVFGTGFVKFFPADIEVLRDGLGKPYVNLYKGAKEAADLLKIRRIHVTISNTKEYAFAVAVGEGE